MTAEEFENHVILRVMCVLAAAGFAMALYAAFTMK